MQNPPFLQKHVMKVMTVVILEVELRSGGVHVALTPHPQHFTLRHVSHSATYFAVSRFILVYQKFSSSLDTFCSFPGGWNIMSNEFHP
jgi:hypothetical protein